MQRAQRQGNRVDWGSLSPLLMREHAERQALVERQGRSVDVLASLPTGSMLDTGHSKVYVQDVRPVPMGRMMTLTVCRCVGV